MFFMSVSEKDLFFSGLTKEGVSLHLSRIREKGWDSENQELTCFLPLILSDSSWGVLPN